MLLKFSFAFCAIPQVKYNRRPHPVVKIIAVAYLTQYYVHLLPWDGHVRTYLIILKRDILDTVATEQDQIPDILLIGSGIPGIVGIGPGTIA
jgi:hypothetical protein